MIWQRKKSFKKCFVLRFWWRRGREKETANYRSKVEEKRERGEENTRNASTSCFFFVREQPEVRHWPVGSRFNWSMGRSFRNIQGKYSVFVGRGGGHCEGFSVTRCPEILTSSGLSLSTTRGSIKVSSSLRERGDPPTWNFLKNARIYRVHRCLVIRKKRILLQFS